MALTLPIKQKSWLFLGEAAAVTDGTLSALENYKTLLLALHNHLLSLGFTVVLCSDGVTVDSSNLWNTIDDIVFAGNGFLASGSPHSWVVWQHPTRSCQLVFDCNSGTGNGRICAMAFHPSGGFSGGTTSQRATAVGEAYPFSGNNGGGTFINWAGASLSSFAGWVIVMHSDDDDITRVVIWNETNNQARGMMGWEVLNNPQGDFVNDLFWWFGGGSEFNEDSTIVATQRWLIGLDSAGAELQLLPGSLGYVPSGNGYTNRLMKGTTGQSNTLESGSPNSYPFAPVFVLAGLGGVGGTMTDMYFGPDQPVDDATGLTCTYPVSTTIREWFQRNNLILPWTGNGLLPLDAVSGEEAEGYAIVFGGGVGGGDTTAPAIGNFTPAAGTPITRDSIINFDVTDASGLLRAAVFVKLGDDVFVVHDGDKFRGSFTNFSSRSVITDGFRYSIRPNGGWVSSPTFEILAVDTDGNEAN